ncbi:hypothetical protein FVEN_g3696 [Fusarium venenatum]|nr:hypothetical protein FVEN_g3696 [Fusarium venenatum]
MFGLDNEYCQMTPSFSKLVHRRLKFHGLSESNFRLWIFFEHDSQIVHDTQHANYGMLLYVNFFLCGHGDDRCTSLQGNISAFPEPVWMLRNEAPVFGSSVVLPNKHSTRK